MYATPHANAVKRSVIARIAPMWIPQGAKFESRPMSATMAMLMPTLRVIRWSQRMSSAAGKRTARLA